MTYTPLQLTWADRLADVFWRERAAFMAKLRCGALAICAGLLLAALAI